MLEERSDEDDDQSIESEDEFLPKKQIPPKINIQQY